MDVSRNLKGRLKSVLREFQGCFKGFHESSIDDEVLRMFRGRFMIFKVFVECFKEV